MVDGHEGWPPDEGWPESAAGGPDDLAGPDYDDGLGFDHGLLAEHGFAAEHAPPADQLEPAGHLDGHAADPLAGLPPGAADADAVPGDHALHPGLGLAGEPAEPVESVVDAPEPAEPPQPVDALPFPPSLALDVTPADGQPWVDPGLLGADIAAPDLTADPPDGLALAPPVDPPADLLADLDAADGGDGAAGPAALAASADPAIRTLAAYWSA